MEAMQGEVNAVRQQRQFCVTFFTQTNMSSGKVCLTMSSSADAAEIIIKTEYCNEPYCTVSLEIKYVDNRRDKYSEVQISTANK